MTIEFILQLDPEIGQIILAAIHTALHDGWDAAYHTAKTALSRRVGWDARPGTNILLATSTAYDIVHRELVDVLEVATRGQEAAG